MHFFLFFQFVVFSAIALDNKCLIKKQKDPLKRFYFVTDGNLYDQKNENCFYVSSMKGHLYIYIYIYIYTHTHTYIYIFSR